MRVFDFVSDDHGTSAMKTCSLVCKKWRWVIQPRLLSSVTIRRHSEQLDEAEEMIQWQRIGHFVRKLILRSKKWTVVPAEFNKISDLQLFGVEFPHLEDFYVLLRSISTTVHALRIIHCSIDSDGETYDITPTARLESNHDSTDPHQRPSLQLTLHSLKVVCYCYPHLIRNVLLWLAQTPTAGSLRRLKVVVRHMLPDLLSQLCLFVSNPECILEELEIYFSKPPGRDLSECTLLHLLD
jgi:hypothetical protein